MRFKRWLLISESKGEVPYWYHWKGEENPIPAWAQDIPTYHQGLTRQDQQYPGFLDLYPHEYYSEPGAGRSVWHTPDGELGYSLLPHDGKHEISGVYNLGGKKRAGQGKYAVRRGFTHGGNLLHAFEDDDKFSLPHYYHRIIGAQPTAYYPFDPKQASQRWDYERFGRPGLVRLEIPPEAHQDMDRWLRADHGELSHDEFQDRLRYLKRLALGSAMKEGQDKTFNTERMSKEEIDRLVQGVDDIYFGGGTRSFEPDDLIGRYIEFKAEQEGISFNEAAERSMARLYGQIHNKAVVIVTAFRSERSLAENRAMNRSLANDLRSLHWGYTPVLGGFVEKTAEGEKRVHEESFFVNATGDYGSIVATVRKLLEKYEQEAALVKLPEQPDAVLLWANGTTSPVGQWHADPDQMAQYYTRMRSGPAGRQFKFEAAGDDSMMTRYAVDDFFRKRK